MGMNYYLESKVGDYWNLPNSDKLGENVNRLVVSAKNYGWRTQTLYIDDLTEKTYKLHIGKSSAGWHFSLCIYPFLNIYTLDDWKLRFKSDRYRIVDEYDNEVSEEDMLEIITNRSNNVFDSNYSMTLVKENNAERGLNGLWAHKSSITDDRDDPAWKCFIPIISTYIRTDGTYDLTPDWNFV